MEAPQGSSPAACWSLTDAGPVLTLSGHWQRGIEPTVVGPAPSRPPVRFEASSLEDFDSSLPAFLLALLRSHPNTPLPPLTGLPSQLHGLMELALAVPEELEATPPPTQASALAQLGKATLLASQSARTITHFTGLAMLSLGRFLIGRARFRPREFWVILQECGPQALPIVALISFLTGLILAFVGNVQLANFGASLYVADLVGIAMVREMGVVMTAILMSGRTGAAYAAHLGSMNANQEIDALQTFGIDPFDFLVLPRMIALVLMMPLLTLFANAIGIFGGMLVGAAVHIPPVLYWNETLASVSLTTSLLGVFKSVFFGAVIAICGCLQGMRAGHSSADVGQATTRAVVASITTIIILDSAFAAIFTILDI